MAETIFSQVLEAFQATADSMDTAGDSLVMVLAEDIIRMEAFMDMAVIMVASQAIAGAFTGSRGIIIQDQGLVLLKAHFSIIQVTG